MNVQDAIDKLKKFPPTMEIMVTDDSGEFDYKPLEEMHVKKVLFSENGERVEPFAEDECLILGEDS